MSLPRPAILLTFVALVAAGCASDRPRPIETTSADRHKPVVTEEIARLDLAPRRSGLTAPDRDAVAGFLREYRALGHGPLVVAGPSGPDAEALADDVRRIAASTGGGAGRLAPTVDAGGGYSLSFVRYRAHVPECGRVWPSLSQTARSETYDNFGCATNANLAAMIADPADLIAPRDMTPADATRRRTVLEGYRSGEVTASERSSGESASVSGLGN